MTKPANPAAVDLRAETRVLTELLLVVVSVHGVFDDHARRAALSHELLQLPERFKDAVGVVIDVTNATLALRAYMPVSLHVRLEPFLEPLPWAWAASEASAAELAFDMSLSNEAPRAEAWIFASVDEALAEVARQCKAAEIVERSVGGAVLRRVQQEARGLRVERYVSDGTSVDTLWVGRSQIESALRDADGNVTWRSESPVLDARGEANAACRAQARLSFVQDGRLLLDLNPESTGRPRSPDWLATFRAAAKVFGLDLSNTPTTDADVADALDACPELESLTLDNTKVTSRSLERIGAAPKLKYLGLEGCKVARAKLKALMKRRPELQISGVWL